MQRAFRHLNSGTPFDREWSLDAICHRLEQVRRGEIRRLIINMPPRSLKSMTASVAFPAFLLGHDPTQRVICVSYSDALAKNIANEFRSLIDTQFYRDLFPGTRVSDTKNNESEVVLTARGGRLATSVGGTLTGRGGDLIVIDDPLGAQDAYSDQRRGAANAWFKNTLLSRLNNQRTGAIVIVMQRLHMDDLTGFVTEGNDDWTVLSLPAIAVEDEVIDLGRGRSHRRRIEDVLSVRSPREVLNRLRSNLGSDLFESQYQQSPGPPGGAMFKRAWVQRFDAPPARGRIIQSWDTATKTGPENDWSVCVTCLITYNPDCYFIIDVFRARIGYPELHAKVHELRARYRPGTIFIEDAGVGSALLQDPKLYPRPTACVAKQSKEVRASMASLRFEKGQIFPPWLAAFEAELFAFPKAKHDDQVDAVSQFLTHKDPNGVWWRLGQD